jgi:hypothetical protein
MQAAARSCSPRRTGNAALFAMLCALQLLAAGKHGHAEARNALAHNLLDLSLPGRPVHVHRFRLPVAGLRIEVVDLAYSTPLADVLSHGDLVVNGGFWGFIKSRRTVLGLLTSGSRQIAPFRSQLDGGVLLVSNGLAKIVPSRSSPRPVASELALQCRPRLVHAGNVIDKLNAQGRAPRTAVCVRDAGSTLDVYVTEPFGPSPTLHELGSWLAAQGCEHALNLDGGPSTAAAYREGAQVVRIGGGEGLPYALRFTQPR